MDLIVIVLSFFIGLLLVLAITENYKWKEALIVLLVIQIFWFPAIYFDT